MLKRALQAVLDGVTLGALIQEAPHPVMAYIALLAVVLFLIGVFLLPRRDGRSRYRNGLTTVTPAKS